MKAVIFVALFALVALVNGQQGALFCAFSDNACATAVGCTYFFFGTCVSFPGQPTNAFQVTGTLASGYIATYSPSTACYTGGAPTTNGSFTQGTCNVTSFGAGSFQIYPNTTQLWTTFYSTNTLFGAGNATCPVIGTSSGSISQSTSSCAVSNCSCPTAYSCYQTSACTVGSTRPTSPSAWTIQTVLYTDSGCSNVWSVSGQPTFQTGCIQSSASTSSQSASSSCSSASSTINVYSTPNCTGNITTTSTTNGSCTLNTAGYYVRISCNGFPTTSSTSTGGTTSGTTSTGGTSATTSTASPVFIHLAVIALSFLVFLGLLL